MTDIDHLLLEKALSAMPTALPNIANQLPSLPVSFPALIAASISSSLCAISSTSIVSRHYSLNKHMLVGPLFANNSEDTFENFGPRLLRRLSTAFTSSFEPSTEACVDNQSIGKPKT